MGTLFEFLDVEEDDDKKDDSVKSTSESKTSTSETSNETKSEPKKESKPKTKKETKKESKPKTKKTKYEPKQGGNESKKFKGIYLVIVLAVVALLMVGAFVLLSSNVSVDGEISSDDSDMGLVAGDNEVELSFSDISNGSVDTNNIKFEVKDIFLDSDGWYFLWSTLDNIPENVSGIIVRTNYYDAAGHVIETSNDPLDEAMDNSIDGEYLISCCEVIKHDDVKKIEIALIDSQSNVLNERTYEINR